MNYYHNTILKRWIELNIQKREKPPVQFFATLVEKVNKAIKEGRDVINLGQGNPDQSAPNHIVKALQLAAEDPQNHKYSPFRGLTELKEAVAEFYKTQYIVEINTLTEEAILFGAKTGLVEIPMCLLNEGDECCFPIICQVQY